MSSSMGEWRRSEPRAVRPFFGTRTAEEAVASSTIQLFEGEAASTETTFDVDELDLSRLDIVITPQLEKLEDWLPEGYKAKDFSLAVIARNSLLKRTKILLNSPASVFFAHPVKPSSEYLEYLGGGRNLNLTVALCLTSDKPQKSGVPFLVGHWLASKTFLIREKSSNSLFDVRTRTDEEWVAAGYPAKTLYSVEYTAGIADEPEGDNPVSVAVVHFHVDAFNKMAGQKLGDALQPMVAADILAQIIEQSFPEWKDVTNPEKRSPLANLLKKFNDTPMSTIEGLKSKINSPAKMRAVIQDRFAALHGITGGSN